MKASNVNENESTNFAFIKKYIRLHGKGDSVYRTLVSLNIYIKLLSINCEDHQSCTWHDSTKFAGFASDGWLLVTYFMFSEKIIFGVFWFS